jgi:hypothetical protein
MSLEQNLYWESFVHTGWYYIIALGILLSFLALTTAWQSAGIVAAMLLIGFSAQLAVTEPQWFQLIDFKTRGDHQFKWGIILQAAVSLAVILLHRKTIRFRSLLTALVKPRVVLFGLLLAASSFSAFVHIKNADIETASMQLMLAISFLAVNLLSVSALFVSLPAEKLERLNHAVTRRVSVPGASPAEREWDKSIPLVSAAWVLLVSLLLCLFAFDRLPHVEDEVAYLFQAKTLLSGSFFSPVPVVPEAFEHYLLNASGDRWFAITSPGWALILAPGVAAGVAWLVNPVLAAGSILLSHSLVTRMTDRGTANLLVILLAVSPWFVAMSASLMNHTASLALLLGSWLALLHSRTKQSVQLAFLAGLFMGVLFLTRSLDGLVAGVLTGLWSLGFVKIKRGLRLVVAYGLGCVATGSLIFVFNGILTGDSLTTPLNQYADQIWYPGANRLGFGPDIGPPNNWGQLDLSLGHSPWEALANLQNNMYLLNFDLFGWAAGSMFLAYFFVVWGRWSLLETGCIVFILVLIGAYSLYWFNGSFFIGPRYWYLVIIPLALISIRGLQTIIQKLNVAGGRPDAGARTGAVVLVLAAISLMSFLPWKGTMKYFEFRGYHSQYRDLAASLDGKKSLVFINNTNNSDFGSAMMLNEPLLAEAPVIFARDLGPESNRAVAEAYPARDIYFVRGRDIWTHRIRVRSGPLSVDDMRGDR